MTNQSLVNTLCIDYGHFKQYAIDNKPRLLKWPQRCIAIWTYYNCKLKCKERGSKIDTLLLLMCAIKSQFSHVIWLFNASLWSFWQTMWSISQPPKYIHHSISNCQHDQEGLCNHWKGTRIFTLTSHNLCNSTPILKVEVTIYAVSIYKCVINICAMMRWEYCDLNIVTILGSIY